MNEYKLLSELRDRLTNNIKNVYYTSNNGELTILKKVKEECY